MDNTVKSVNTEPKISAIQTSNVKDKKTDTKESSFKEKYFNAKTITGSLIGLAVLGTVTVLGIKKWHGSNIKETKPVIDKNKINTDIHNIKENIKNVKELINENYIEQRTHLYNELSTSDEYGINIRFSSLADLKNQMKELQANNSESLTNADNIIEANKKKIEETSKKLSDNPEWKKILSIREQCRKIIKTSKDNEQKKIAAEKIPLLNELIYSRVYPESLEKANSYGIEDSKLFELVKKKFATLNDFMKEFEALKTNSGSFDYDISEKKIAHSGALTERDIFPKEYDIIESNMRIKKDYEEKIAEYKKIYERVIDELKSLANEYRNSSEVNDLRNLIKQLNIKRELLNRAE